MSQELSPWVQDLRALVDDADHGIRHRRLRGEADTIEHIVECAVRAGVPREECTRLATEYFRLLMATAAPPERRRLRKAQSRTALPGA